MKKIILLPSYAEAVTELFNYAFDGEFMIGKELVQQNIFGDENYDPKGCVGFFQGDELIGFVCCKYNKVPIGSEGLEPEKGWIICLAVKKEYRNQGLGSELLTFAEEFLKSKGKKIIVLGWAFKRFFVGVPDQMAASKRFFEKRGYSLGERLYDLINLDALIMDGFKTNYNLEYREMRHEDTEKVVEFVNRSFGGSWAYLIGTYIRNYPDKPEDIFIVLDDGKVIGFAKIYDKNSTYIGPPIFWSKQMGPEYGGLGPIGIDEAYRGRHVGITLLLEALKTLKKRGCGSLAVDCTQLLGFYGKLGLLPWKVFRPGSKEV